MAHVRSADTSTPAASSRAELDRILQRYGCSRSGQDYDRASGTIAIWFTVPDSSAAGARDVPVRLVVRLADVTASLQAHYQASTKHWRQRVTPELVERVAWRHVVFLVEAGLVAADAGVKKVSEFFLADTVVRDNRGREARLIDALDSQTPEWRALLGPPAEAAHG